MSQPEEKRPAEEDAVPDDPQNSKARAAPVKLTLLLPDGGHYVGDCNEDSVPHGEGTKYRADGSEAASGQWRDGKLHGRGKKMYSSDDRYFGEFVCDAWDGLGALTFSDVEDQWADYLSNGLCVESDKVGEVFHDPFGCWPDDQLVEQCPVPSSEIPFAKFVSAAGEPRRRVDEASGQWRNGKNHGQGKVAFDGDRYEGDFFHGDQNGLGMLTSANGVVYEGEWSFNELRGFGVMWAKDGNLLECGRFANGKLFESCAVPRSKIPIGARLSAAAQLAALICPGGGFYCGALNAINEPHGPGALHRSDGSEAIRGDWTDGRLAVGGARDADGRLQGAASEWSADGLFEGKFVDGQRSGLGVVTMLNYHMFEGEWTGGRSSGLGVLWDKAGKVVECGRWAYDELVEERPVPRSKIPVGAFLSESAKDAPIERTLLLPDGGHFVGKFNAKFRPHGEGTQYRADDSEAASGQWRDGQQHGRGKWTDPEGDRYEGKFVDGQRNGLGAFTWAEGSVFEGEWADDKHSGFGVKWDEAGKVVGCGHWVNEWLAESRPVPRSKIPIGSFLSAAARAADPQRTLLLPSGGHFVGEFNANLRPHGEGVKFHAGGSEAASGQWCDGKMHGCGTVSLNGGRYVGNFVHGKLSGLGTFTWKDGDVYEGELAAGNCNGFGIKWNKNGRVLKSGLWKDDKLVETGPVPRSKLPTGTIRNAGANDAALLYPDGRFYRGEITDRLQRHGKGSMHAADGAHLERGQWLNDVLQPDRKALLIGNNAYTHSPLSCCRNDAEDMRAVLTKLGFECTLLLDANRIAMIAGVGTFIQSLQRGDIVFVYFSGHGEESEGHTYLIPTDYPSSGDVDNAVSLSAVMQRLNRLDLDLTNIIVLDCCRADDNNATFKSKSISLSAPLQSSSVRLPSSGHFFVAFSSDPGTVSFESGGRNGRFTACLLPELVIPGRRLAAAVAHACAALQKLNARNQQRAWVHFTPHPRLDELVLLEGQPAAAAAASSMAAASSSGSS